MPVEGSEPVVGEQSQNVTRRTGTTKSILLVGEEGQFFGVANDMVIEDCFEDLGKRVC
jgi:hypothetical protein